MRYTPGTTSVEDSAAVVFERGQGVCQDQAHVFVACCRAAGIPARYVSGYLCSVDGTDSASHAWVDAWLEDAQGWLGIDVTHLGRAEPSTAAWPWGVTTWMQPPCAACAVAAGRK